MHCATSCNNGMTCLNNELLKMNVIQCSSILLSQSRKFIKYFTVTIPEIYKDFVVTNLEMQKIFCCHNPRDVQNILPSQSRNFAVTITEM